MTSVAWFYKIEGGEWDEMAAVSNGFQNGDEFGIPGGHVVNEAIPACP